MSDEQIKLLYALALLLLDSGILGVLAVAARRWLVAHLGAARFDQAVAIAGHVVAAVEQQAHAEGWDGAAKLPGAIARAQALGAAHGVDLGADQWRVLIEAAVHALRVAGDELVAPGPDPQPPASPPVSPADGAAAPRG